MRLIKVNSTVFSSLAIVFETHFDELLSEGLAMGVDAVNEDVTQLIDFIGFQVDFIGCLLPLGGFFELQLFFQVENLVVTPRRQGVVVHL